MSDIVVRTIPGSPYGRSVLVTLLEKGAPFHLVPWPLDQFQSAEHYAIHPFGRVPWIEHDGFSLYESQAIMRYIDRVAGGPRLMPEDPQALGRVDSVLNVSDAYLYGNVATTLGYHRITVPMRFGTAPDEEAIAAALPKSREVFAALAHILGDGEFIAGDSLTLADIAVASQFGYLVMAPEFAELIGPHDRLQAWFERMMARPSFQETTFEKFAGMAEAA